MKHTHKQEFKIFQGYDHFNGINLYQVKGVNNEYLGEWTTDKAEAIQEKNSLKH